VLVHTQDLEAISAWIADNGSAPMALGGIVYRRSEVSGIVGLIH
jgi:hypothetical protein